MRRALAGLLAALAVAAASPCAANDYGLRDAARMDQIEAVRTALEAGADPNDYRTEYSPLMFAAGNGDAEMVGLLLAWGARTEHRDHNGDRALLWAVERRHIECVRLLLSAGSPADSDDDPYQITPLMKAAGNGDEATARLLLAYGADPRRRDHTEDTALHGAARSRSVELVRLLLSAGADPGAVADILDHTPLHEAAQYGGADVVRVLAEAGVDLEARDYEGKTPLWMAAALDRADIVEALLAAGANPDARADNGDTPFMAAAEKSGAAAAKLVESTKALDDAFASAVWGGHDTLAMRLAERGADPNASTREGRPALAGVARYPGAEMLHWFLAHGADLGRHGPAALAEAAQAGRADLVAILLEAGVPADARAANGATALLQAAGGGHVDIVRALLARGADPAAKDAEGRGVAEYMAATTGMIGWVIEQREGSRAWRPTDDLHAQLEALRRGQAEVRTLLGLDEPAQGAGQDGRGA